MHFTAHLPALEQTPLIGDGFREWRKALVLLYNPNRVS